MKRILTASLAALLSFSAAAAAQNTNSSATSQGTAGVPAARKRGPVFRATKEQIKQAQTMLRQRGFYGGEATGKLDAETRAGLRKFQEAENLKVSGTLNRATLEKMSITLTERQAAMQ